MKYFVSPSLPVVFLLSLLSFNACKPEYNIETAVRFATSEVVSDELRAKTEAQLLQRLQEGEGDDFVLSTTEKGFKVISTHTNQPIAAMAGMMGYFGSADLGIYDVFPVDEPGLKEVLEDFPWPDYVERGGSSEGYLRGLVASTTNIARRNSLVDALTAATPKEVPVRYLWSKPNRVTAAGQGPARSFDLIAVRTMTDNQGPRLGNAAIADAKVSSTQDGQIAVMVDFTPEAAIEWEEMTAEAAADANRSVAIVVNNTVLSCPSVREAITGGKAMITGDFSVEIADAMAQQLKWAPLPVALELVAQNVIE